MRLSFLERRPGVTDSSSLGWVWWWKLLTQMCPFAATFDVPEGAGLETVRGPRTSSLSSVFGLSQ